MKLPALSETVERHYAIVDYAETNELKFYDFNERGMLERIGFNYGQDISDCSEGGDRSAHVNPSGARKMTNYLENELRQTFGLGPVLDGVCKRIYRPDNRVICNIKQDVC